MADPAGRLYSVDPGLYPLPGSTNLADWKPGLSKCCGARVFAIVMYRVPVRANAGDELTPEVVAVVCPSCPLVTLERVDRLTILGKFDLLGGRIREFDNPPVIDQNELYHFFNPVRSEDE